MFIHNINPVAFTLGPLTIRYYGIIYALGFLITYLYLRNAAKKKEIPLSGDDIDTLLLFLIIGTVLGARLAEIIFYNPSYYLSNPQEIIALWHGGLSFHGGLIGAALATLMFSRKRAISFLKLADILVIPTSFALALGRIANFINAELYGTPTNLPWAVQFPNDPLYRHPSQLYEAAKNVLIAGALLLIKKKNLPDGSLLALFLIFYGAIRFFIEFVKEPEVMLGPLAMGQWLSIPMVIIGSYLLRKQLRKDS